MKKTFVLSAIAATVLISVIACGDEPNDVADEIQQENLEDSIVYETNNTRYNTRGIEAREIDFHTTTPVQNKAAYVTSQCYTKTQDDQLATYNPCFSCHIDSQEPNYIDDWDLQQAYAFGEYTKINRFTNLFKDRTELVAQISDEEIEEYVQENNYMQQGEILLKHKLQNVPQEWDVDGDGKWGGYTPDCYFNFDSEGFDKDPNGEYTLWRAFAYYPFLGTFWPTNGSTDDVLIRLHKDFAKNSTGEFDLNIYKLNLSIVEALIKQEDVVIDTVDESLYGVDLNQNGLLDHASKVVYKWEKPSYDSATNMIADFSMSYVGLAKVKLATNEYLIAPGLYPKETEFLHSVRYIQTQESSVSMASRMKELRYAKKVQWASYRQLANAALSELREKEAFPDRVRTVIGNTEVGVVNDLGWVYQGFIEDAKGELRPQNYEETLYCVGCHSGIGATVDSSFVFSRKFDTNATMQGWYHWTQNEQGFKSIKEPQTLDGRGEYTLYLQQNRAGDEFRCNTEVMEKFFLEDGSIKEDALSTMQEDISYLILPSQQRALELNKAYKIIVEEQSFIYGRDAHVKPLENVHREVEVGQATQLEAVRYSK